MAPMVLHRRAIKQYCVTHILFTTYRLHTTTDRDMNIRRQLVVHYFRYFNIMVAERYHEFCMYYHFAVFRLNVYIYNPFAPRRE